MAREQAQAKAEMARRRMIERQVEELEFSAVLIDMVKNIKPLARSNDRDMGR
jgi:hypothetical protein